MSTAPTAEEVKAREAAGLPTVQWWRRGDGKRLYALPVYLSTERTGSFEPSVLVDHPTLDEVWCAGNLGGDWLGWAATPDERQQVAAELGAPELPAEEP